MQIKHLRRGVLSYNQNWNEIRISIKALSVIETTTLYLKYCSMRKQELL